MYSAKSKSDGGTLNDLRNHILRLKARAGGVLDALPDGAPVLGLVREQSNGSTGQAVGGREWHRESND